VDGKVGDLQGNEENNQGGERGVRRMFVVVESAAIWQGRLNFGGQNRRESTFTGGCKSKFTNFKSDSVGGYRVDGKSSTAWNQLIFQLWMSSG
jgi:hypothetical protein